MTALPFLATAVPLPRDSDFIGFAALVVRVVQHAAWANGPLEIRRSSVLVWSTLQRTASLLSLHGILRTVDTADCLSLSPSPACAALLSTDHPEGAARRTALFAAVSQRDLVGCREVLDGMMTLVKRGKR
jgi:hypothetical protein